MLFLLYYQYMYVCSHYIKNYQKCKTNFPTNANISKSLTLPVSQECTTMSMSS